MKQTIKPGDLVLDNITGTKSLKFPNADATLLSTENSEHWVLSWWSDFCSDLGGRLRLQQHFAGW